jgi:hypothetical protein
MSALSHASLTSRLLQKVQETIFCLSLVTVFGRTDKKAGKLSTCSSSKKVLNTKNINWL